MKPYVVLICFLLLGLIGVNLMAALGFKESFELASKWKDGKLYWDRPYSCPPGASCPTPMNVPDLNGNQINFVEAPQFTDGRLAWDGPYATPPPALPATDISFFMANNRSSPSCCKAATYSTSDGCVCTTKSQQDFINMRGGNRTVEDGF